MVRLENRCGKETPETWDKCGDLGGIRSENRLRGTRFLLVQLLVTVGEQNGGGGGYTNHIFSLSCVAKLVAHQAGMLLVVCKYSK